MYYWNVYLWFPYRKSDSISFDDRVCRINDINTIRIDRIYIYNSHISYICFQHVCNFKHCILLKPIRSRISDIYTSVLWDILKIRRSLLVRGYFRTNSVIFSHVEIHILLFIVNIIPFILYLMLLFLPLFLFIKRNLIFSISLYSLLAVSFQLLKLVFLLSFRHFISTISSISSSISFISLLSLSVLFTLSFPINRNCIFLSSPSFTFYFLQIFFVSIFFFYFYFWGFFWNTILSLSRYYWWNFSGIPFKINSIIELLPLVGRNISKFQFHHGRVFQDDIAPKQGW